MLKDYQKVLKDINKFCLDNSEWDIMSFDSEDKLINWFGGEDCCRVPNLLAIKWPANLLMVYADEVDEWLEYNPDGVALIDWQGDGKVTTNLLVWQLPD